MFNHRLAVGLSGDERDAGPGWGTTGKADNSRPFRTDLSADTTTFAGA